MMHKDIYQLHLLALQDGIEFLPDKPEETAASTLHALWHLAAGQPLCVERATQAALPELDTDANQRLASLIQARLAGTPLAHLTQRQLFMGLEFIVGPQALVPRKETEILARVAEGILGAVLQQQAQALVLDVCTGAGNIALCLAHAHPAARVFAADLSEQAIALAWRNAEHLELAARVEFKAGDLLTPFAQPDFFAQVDLLTCNPPYISSGRLDKMPLEISQHEPKLAFDGGPFGLSLLGTLLKQAPQFLKPGGWLVFEVGLGQAEPLHKRLAKNSNYRNICLHHDNEGNARVLALQA